MTSVSYMRRSSHILLRDVLPALMPFLTFGIRFATNVNKTWCRLQVVLPLALHSGMCIIIRTWYTTLQYTHSPVANDSSVSPQWRIGNMGLRRARAGILLPYELRRLPCNRTWCRYPVHCNSIYAFSNCDWHLHFAAIAHREDRSASHVPLRENAATATLQMSHQEAHIHALGVQGLQTNI